MGSAFGSTGHNTTTTDQTSTSSPWAPQGNQLNNLFTMSEPIVQQQLENGPYTGQLYSGLNNTQNDAINYATNYVNNDGNTADSLNSAASSGINSLGTYSNNAANYASGNFGNVGGANQQITNATNMSGLSGLYDGYTAGNNANSIYGTATTDNTSQNVGDANQYINNSVLNGQIDAANADVSRELNESTLPTLNQQASAGGTLNSSRAGAANAIATQAASEQMANNAANMRASAYNNGLNLAQNSYATNLSGALNANSQLSNLYSTGLSGLNTNQALAQNQGQFNTNAMLQGNAQLGTAAGLGSQYALDGSTLATNNYNLLNTAGTEQQNDANAQLAAQQQAYNNANNYDANTLSEWKNLLSGNYGMTTNTQGSTTSPVQNQGWFQQALGDAGSVAGLAAMFM